MPDVGNRLLGLCHLLKDTKMILTFEANEWDQVCTDTLLSECEAVGIALSEDSLSVGDGSLIVSMDDDSEYATVMQVKAMVKNLGGKSVED